MEEALEMARSKDTKERMAAAERLHQLLESSRKPLSTADATALVDCCMDLLTDGNFRVAQGALQALASAAVLSGEHLKLHFNGLLPAVVERLGDGKQPVRDAARQLIVTLMEVSSPTIIVERTGNYAWTHKSWRVREEFARTVASAVGLFASTELPLQRAILPPVLQLLNDSNYSVREAATLCIEEMYTQAGSQFREELQRYNIPLPMMKEISARLEKIEPKAQPLDGHGSHIVPTEMKSFNTGQKRSSPRMKATPRETSVIGGEGDITEKPVDPIKVYSDKELIKEIEKIASTLVPEKDWSVRIAAMKRVEGLVFGGAVGYPSFSMLLKQLVIPLSTQLSDRRSSIVKQACHLVNLLSKELLGDFETCAEMFIPVLFKLVVITVLVIAESADNCIKTMLRNCKVARALPRIADSAKNDRNAVLRARCCEYALLILEYWADAPEIQRSADIYEDLIRCCVADAMSEVRSTARTCYRMFTKTWPERSRRLFSSFDPVIQRIINDEDGGIHKRYASPSIRERGVQQPRSTSHTSSIPGYGTSALVAMDKSTAISSGTSLSSGSLLSQTKLLGRGSERSLESVLHASKQKVSAIESLLKGVNISDKQQSSIRRSNSLDLGVDAPSSRDPPYPPAVPATNIPSLQSSVLADSTSANYGQSRVRNEGSNLTDLVNQPLNDLPKLSYLNHISYDSVSSLSLPSIAKMSSERFQEGAVDNNGDLNSTRRFSNMQFDRQYLDTPYKDSSYRDSRNYVPNFQRPLLRKQVSSRASTGRKSFDDSQLSVGEVASYMDKPSSLSDALTEGLSPSSDWVARVSAFNYLRALLQQGARGIQEVTQSFEKVMKLFFRHLDDPHHKVAQASLSTLAEIIPPCRKPFESYIERILPYVFSRLIDPKELVRQPCSTTLEIVGSTYGIDSLLPALLRSLDEQRSPKAKLAVIEFANNSFDKHAGNSDVYSNNGFLKLWLAKLTPLVHDKNTKLKEAAISGIISIYTHFDSASVLNFILSLSVEEQNSLRRAIKLYTPRIDVDLMNFLQSKKERQRSKSFFDQSDAIGSSSEEGYVGTSKKNHFYGRYSTGSVDGESGKKWSSMQESTLVTASISQVTSDGAPQNFHHNNGTGSDTETSGVKSKNLMYNADALWGRTGSWIDRPEKADSNSRYDSPVVTPRLDINRTMSPDDGRKAVGLTLATESIQDMEFSYEDLAVVKSNLSPDNGPSIPQLLHQICVGNDGNATPKKREALQLLVEASVKNDQSMWTKYFNQILTAVLEVLDDADASIRELSPQAEVLTAHCTCWPRRILRRWMLIPVVAGTEHKPQDCSQLNVDSCDWSNCCRTRPRSLQSDVAVLNSCKEAVSTGEEETKLSGTGMAGQWRTSSDFSFATENVVYKRRKLLPNNPVCSLSLENRPDCRKKTDDHCIKSSVDNSLTLLNVVPGVTPSTTIDCNDALDCVMPSIYGPHYLEKPSEDLSSQVIENNNLESVQIIPPCDGVGKEPGELSLCILTKPGSAYNCGTNVSSSSLRSNIGHCATSMNVEAVEGGKYSSSDGVVAELPGGFNSIKEMCISVLKNHGSLGRVSATSARASLNNHGNLGGVSATSTCASLKVTGAVDANCSRSCKICRRSENPLKMLLCDNCEEAFHVSCSRAKVKKPHRVAELSEWYCQPCIRKNPKCLLKSSKRYISKPRIGKDFQAEVPEWAGPVSNKSSYFEEPLELDPTDFLTIWNVSKPAVICNWLQCQEVTYEDDDDYEGTKCSKWRRAPLFEVQTEDWDCSCAVTWDPIYADCAVPQELDQSIVQKHLKYVEEWRSMLAANQRARENNNRRRRRR